MPETRTGALLVPPQDSARRPVGRGVALHQDDVTSVAGGRDVGISPVTKRVLEAYVEVARQMSAYLAARPL